MAAGQGFKTFVTGEVLTAGDVNGYLMQGINVFTNATARDAAITAPAEGQFAFTKDNNSLWYYDGAAWVASGATGDIEGVTAGVGISGGGTSGTVTVTNSMATAIDAKGDLVPGTGADTFARLAVGANDTVLTADSSTATGLKWAAAAAGGANWTAVNSGGTNLSGANTITVSGITGADQLMVVVILGSSSDTTKVVDLRFNSDSGSNYNMGGMQLQTVGSYNVSEISTYGVVTNDRIRWARTSNDAEALFNGYLTLSGGNAAGPKMFNYIGAGGSSPASVNNQVFGGGGWWDNSSTITSVTIFTSVANFDAGKIYVFKTS
jgi:hypothetical protein